MNKRLKNITQVAVLLMLMLLIAAAVHTQIRPKTKATSTSNVITPPWIWLPGVGYQHVNFK